MREIVDHNNGQLAEVILLGDYIDRGPDSAGVVEDILTRPELKDFELTCLKGNHEATLLEFLDDPGVGPSWGQYGGQETLISYGVQPPLKKTDQDAWEACRQAFRSTLPKAHLEFYQSLQLKAERGDYFFAHAGIDPSRSLDLQREADLLWSREKFLFDTRKAEKIIVHGHTPEEKPHRDHRRVGLDTGAYQTGRLSVGCFSGEDVSFWTT
tara:strand:- start:2654 stop:3286 length:633 start_codon:yes stop_codon:yes gene_type:complete